MDVGDRRPLHLLPEVRHVDVSKELVLVLEGGVYLVAVDVFGSRYATTTRRG